MGVLFSIGAYFMTQAMTETVARTQFEHLTSNIQFSTQARIQSYIDILRSTGALFHASTHVTREEFHSYVNNLKLEENFPGINSVNFAMHVKHAEKAAFERAVRVDASLHSSGYSRFAISPHGERAEYTVLTYVEPMDRNPDAFGYDLSSHPGVARTLQQARDSGEMYSSGRMIQVHGPYKHVGLAIRKAIYKPGMPVNTVEQRRAAYYGSVGIGFDFHQLMREAIGQTNSVRFVQVKIVDLGPTAANQAVNGDHEPALIFDSMRDLLKVTAVPDINETNGLVKTVSIPFASRTWQLEFGAQRSALLSNFDRYLPGLILVISLFATLLLYGVYYFLLTSRQRATQIANEMTKDLRRSESHLAEAQRMANLGSWQLDASSQAMQWSLETFRILGRSPSTSLGLDDFLKHVHEEDRPAVKDGLDQALLNSAEFDYEHRIVRQDGSVRWVHTLCRSVKNDRRKKVRGTIMDITERKITMQALQRSQELLRELTAHQDRIKEEERRRIAREIHDELGQTLLALRIDISMLEARTSQRHPRLNARIRTALQQLDATVRAVRGIINDLRPSVLDLGLVAAIEWQVAEFRRRSDIECELFIDDPEITVDNDSATTLFRILQESLTNIIRHAHASRIAVALYSQDGWLTLKIMDNGVGMAPDEQKKPESFGLVGIEERVIALNGRFSVTSMPNSGTTLLVAIPLNREEMPSFVTLRRALVRDVDFLPRATQSSSNR